MQGGSKYKEHIAELVCEGGIYGGRPRVHLLLQYDSVSAAMLPLPTQLLVVYIAIIVPFMHAYMCI